MRRNKKFHDHDKLTAMMMMMMMMMMRVMMKFDYVVVSNVHL